MMQIIKRERQLNLEERETLMDLVDSVDLMGKIPVRLPNTANFKNIVIATKQRGITSIKRLYEKVLGNKSFHTVRTQYR